VNLIRQRQKQGRKIRQCKGRHQEIVFLDETGLGLHVLEDHVALNHVRGGTLPAFHLVQNGLRRLGIACQLGGVLRVDTPCLPFRCELRVPCYYHVKLIIS
jgi:hypothetical protein